MKFARTVFLIAGVYGLLVMLPQYLENTRWAIDEAESGNEFQS